MQSLRRNLGQHLQKLALFVLRSYEEDGEDKGNAQGLTHASLATDLSELEFMSKPSRVNESIGMTDVHANKDSDEDVKVLKRL